MSKIISIIIKFLNRINKFIWKIIIFLSQFIKVDEINHLDDKPQDVKYRLFNVDDPAIIEPFVSIEHKDYKQLIKDNNIKPVKIQNIRSSVYVIISDVLKLFLNILNMSNNRPIKIPFIVNIKNRFAWFSIIFINPLFI